ncbi:hypothetical protein NKW43_15430 [Gluconobacter albidus]|uniref:hypothetical protein n=1 Tax=Gluconobacter albidus TaxID=318683 RepID=UPI00209E605B|nr:hypothetical protein [Gluconobacter albidus]MCP1275048.1 hypothetical protein [Gluconobacter albidus]
MSEALQHPVTRPEFDRALNDIDSLKAGQIRTETKIEQVGAEMSRNSGMLKEVLAEMADQKRDRSARDGAMRKTVWAANSLGPTILLILLGLLQHWGLK